MSGAQILAGVIGSPNTSRNCIRTDPSRRYIGPTAQDFQAAFGLGEDTNGVTLVAVQELGKENEKLEEEKEASKEEEEETNMDPNVFVKGMRVIVEPRVDKWESWSTHGRGRDTSRSRPFLLTPFPVGANP